MPSTLAAHARRGLLLRRCLLLFGVLLAGAQLAEADTLGRIQRAPDSGCYCHCSESHTRGGCVKMCELKKYASRWWATTCVKPRQPSVMPNPGASPRLPHPDRAEHARL